MGGGDAFLDALLYDVDVKFGAEQEQQRSPKFEFDDLLNANGELAKDEKHLLDSDVRSGIYFFEVYITFSSIQYFI